MVTPHPVRAPYPPGVPSAIAQHLIDRRKRQYAKDMTVDDEIEWRVTPGLSPYAETVAEMEARAAAIRAGEARELIWLLEHPPLYTAGTSAEDDELLLPDRFPVFRSGRGGRYTYHGPGQRVGYVLLDLDKRGRDVRCFVAAIENWVIATLADFGIAGRSEPGRVGIWTGHGADEAKIGAIGVRVRRWVSFHGFSLNVDPDLSHFSGIVPCGLGEFAVTSMARLGVAADMTRVDEALHRHFPAMLAALRCSSRSDKDS
ncbi:lipoyl(octanoyl) transferase [Rhizorhabdus histidinilytica]|uniref:Octanoyltransferase n=2 Tax=Rhizorhabdus histidinilytica TaxID=439228 RepID=A0A1T5C3J7_9SPHN|nr:lipoyl(octanoyl) transferase [Rhizorhabdus histidinilytica]